MPLVCLRETHKTAITVLVFAVIFATGRSAGHTGFQQSCRAEGSEESSTCSNPGPLSGLTPVPAPMLRQKFVLCGDSLTQQSYNEGGWGARLACLYQRKVQTYHSCLCCCLSSVIRFFLNAALGLARQISPCGVTVDTTRVGRCKPWSTTSLLAQEHPCTLSLQSGLEPMTPHCLTDTSEHLHCFSMPVHPAVHSLGHFLSKVLYQLLRQV